MNKGMKKVLVSAMVLALIAPAVNVPRAEAAAKPKLSAKTVNVTVGKTKKVTVKNVKVKKIKKTTWKIKSSKVAKLSSQKKTSVSVKGVKKGTTKLTASVKVGKKTYPLKATVNVKKKSVDPVATNTPSVESSKPTEPAAPTPLPTLRTLTQVTVQDVPKKDADTFPTTPPQGKVDEATKVTYKVDFENIAVGTKEVVEHKTNDKGDEEYSGKGIEDIYLRGYAGPDNKDVGQDYLQVVDGSEVPDEDKTNKTHVLKCHRQAKTWQGPMIKVTDKLEAGCTYKWSAKVFGASADLTCTYQQQVIKELKESYGEVLDSNNRKIRIPKGKWSTVELTVTAPDDTYYYGLYFESYDQGVGEIYVDDITLTKLAQVNPDKSIPKLRDMYKDVFPIVGVGAGMESIIGKNGSEFIQSQFNAYTPGNEMKPDAIMGSTPGKIVKPEDEEDDSTDFFTIEDAKSLGYIIPDDYATFEQNRFKNETGEVVVPRLKFDKVDAIMKACHEKGIKLRGHTLVWHSQTPVFFFQQYFKAAKSSKYNVSKDCMDSRLEFYIKTVFEHLLTSEYADCLYGYDVVNEYLHSRGENFGKYTSYYGLIYGTYDDSVANHKVSLQPSYLKNSFTWAHEMLVKHNRTDVKLFYNDFNCYENPQNIVHLTDFINSNGKVCDGIGMQAHLDITDSFHSAKNFATALEVFRVNSPELEIQITELDAGMNSEKATDQDQAAYYDQIMNAILTNKKKGGNITGLILWSLYDGVSWRAANVPCVFSGLHMPKSAFYAVMDAKKEYWD